MRPLTDIPFAMGDGAAASSGDRRPSILFINQHYWPDVAATAQQLADLAEHLAEQGFDVHVLCSRTRYEAGTLDQLGREVHNGVTIHRVRSTGFGRGRHVGRLADYATYYSQVMGRVMFGRRFDLIVPLTTPPLLSVAAAVAKAVRGQRYGVWSMDLHPDAEFALGMLKPRSAAGRMLSGLHAWSYKKADFVVDLGSCMKERLLNQGIDDARLHTIPVWSRSDEVEPVQRDDNPVRRKLGLEDQFVVMYSGNAGLAHRFADVLAAMHRLRDRDDIVFLFAGNGPRRAEIECFIAEHQLTNARYVDYFPREDLRYSLSVGDLHLVTLRDDMAGIAVPNKLYGIMAAGRPIAMIGPSTSTVAQTILNEGIGFVLPPGMPATADELSDTIAAYAADRSLGAEQGRRAQQAFLARYERRVACNAWSRLLTTVLDGEEAASAVQLPVPAMP